MVKPKMAIILNMKIISKIFKQLRVLENRGYYYQSIDL